MVSNVYNKYNITTHNKKYDDMFSNAKELMEIARKLGDLYYKGDIIFEGDFSIDIRRFPSDLSVFLKEASIQPFQQSAPSGLSILISRKKDESIEQIRKKLYE